MPGEEIGSLAAQRFGSGQRSWLQHRWRTDGMATYPARLGDFVDLDACIARFVLPGHVPDTPPLTRDDKVITLGSCFAQELRKTFNQYGFASDSLWVPSGLNNTYALLDFVSWVATGSETRRAYRYERQDDGSIAEWTPDAERAAYRERFAAAGGFVFTLGLAEVWEDAETGAVFWRGVPAHIYEAGRHRFRVTSVDENVANLHALLDLLREVNPRAPVVLTLSPLPLFATFRDVSCLTADCVSKSVLRVALDQVIAARPARTYYWPSFEIVRWVGGHLDRPAFGTDDGQVHHATKEMKQAIIRAFVRHFYDAATAAGFERRLAAARPPRTVTGRIPTAPDRATRAAE